MISGFIVKPFIMQTFFNCKTVGRLCNIFYGRRIIHLKEHKSRQLLINCLPSDPYLNCIFNSLFTEKDQVATSSSTT